VEGTELTAIAIDGTPIIAFTFEQGHLFLSLQVFDHNSRRVLWVERNELKYRPSAWDITLVGRNLTIRDGAKQILLDVVFNPPGIVEVRRGRFHLNGLLVLVHPDHIHYVNRRNTIANLSFADFDVALMVGDPIDSRRVALALPAGNRRVFHKDGANKPK